MKKVLLPEIILFMATVIVQAQERTIFGRVTSSEDGLGLPGVNVVVKGTTEGTITDMDGNYSMSVSGNTTALVFSFIGMAT